MIGFLIYGPVMLIGVHALDLVPKKAAGTAAGFTGLFGYVGVGGGIFLKWVSERQPTGFKGSERCHISTRVMCYTYLVLKKSKDY